MLTLCARTGQGLHAIAAFLARARERFLLRRRPADAYSVIW